MTYTAAIEAQLQRLGAGGGPGTEAQEAALAAVHGSLGDLQAQHATATRTVMGAWEGSGAGEANSRAATLGTALGTVAGNADAAASVLRDAAAKVGAGRTEIQGLIDEFTAWARGQVAVLRAAPEAAQATIGAGIWARANEAAGRAGEIVGRVESELSGLAGQLRGQSDGNTALDGLGAPLSEPAPALTAPAATAPASVGTDVLAPGSTGSTGGGAPGGTTAGPGIGAGGHGTGGHGAGGHGFGGGSGGAAVGPRLHSVMPIPPGMGVGLALPGGEQAEAPNEIAANAVRYALQQVGMPYVWGAADPGFGFDCSGLTSWSYGMAGLEIPRHSAAQAVGGSVPPGQLMPGDLVVWHGHVAMVIGGGMIVEAGDPVQVNPVRTNNIGMPFLGFYRPTG